LIKRRSSESIARQLVTLTRKLTRLASEPSNAVTKTSKAVPAATLRFLRQDLLPENRQHESRDTLCLYFTPFGLKQATFRGICYYTTTCLG
jgi:hypothetical protein